MSAIDHKAESVRLAELADLSYGAIEHRNGASAVSEAVEALMMATEAGVHATLYAAEQTAELVKQQRIANLIAVTTWNDTALRQEVPTRRINGEVPDYTSERARVDRWFAEVRKGLNLS